MASRHYLCEFCNSLSQDHDTLQCFLNNVIEIDITLGQPNETEVDTNNNENVEQRVENSDDNYLTFEIYAEIEDTPQASTSHVDSGSWNVYKALDEGSFEYSSNCTDIPVPSDSSSHAPDKERKTDARVNEPLMEDAGAMQGPFIVHLQSVAPGEEKRKPRAKKSFVCDNCGKTFTRKHHLNMHARIHTGEKPFKCDICKKTYTQKHTLDDHLRTHTDEKPYSCDFCDKKFSHGTSLRRHNRTHKGLESYKCIFCEKTYAQKHNLVVHLRTHTGEKPYKCQICEKEFGNKSNYNTHLKTHTDEKPYPCDFCDKIFSIRSHRDRHARNHKGQKSYNCGMCGKTFTSYEHCNLHIRQKHQ